MTQPVKHTPGPWHVGLKPGPMVYGPQGEQIVGLNVMLDSDEVLANAKFIATAPAMYAALQQLARVEQLRKQAVTENDYVDLVLADSKLQQLAQAVLAQAEGKL